jgi:choline dehydrogenase-like flavoprotein
VAENYDVIIIGSGAGGGTLAHTLAPSGKRILLLERGDFLPREIENRDPGGVRGREIHLTRHVIRRRRTGVQATGALLRRRGHQAVLGGAVPAAPADFREVKHADGLSLAWPLSYDERDPRRRAPAEPDDVTVLRRGLCDDGPAIEISIPTEKGLRR